MPELQALRILVVDDSPTMQAVCCQLLEANGGLGAETPEASDFSHI